MRESSGISDFADSVHPRLVKPSAISRDQVVSEAEDLTINGIDAFAPDIVFVGNSMVTCGLDTAAVSSLTGCSVMSVISWGAMTAWEFMTLKNVVGNLAHTPRFVVLITRWHFITFPNIRIDGGYGDRIRALRGPEEEVLDKVAYTKPPCGFPDVDDPGPWDFGGRVNDSFLPYMLRIARDRGFRLVIARHKARRFAEQPGFSTAAIAEYTAGLKACIEANGGVFLDYIHFDGLRLEHYADGDHLNPAGRDVWTPRFAADLKAVPDAG